MDSSSPALFYCLLFEHILWKVLNLCGGGENIVMNPRVLLTRLLILRTGFSALSGSQTGSPCSSVAQWSVFGRRRRPVLEAGGVCSACWASYLQTVTVLSFGLSSWRLLSLSYLSVFTIVMESLKRHWHCVSFHLTGCPLHSLLSPRLKFSLFMLDATPQLSPQPSGCAFSAVGLTLSTLKMVYRLYWIVTFTFKFLALKTFTSGPVYSPSWLAALPAPRIPSRVLDSPCSPSLSRPPRATTLPRASRPTPLQSRLVSSFPQGLLLTLHGQHSADRCLSLVTAVSL